MPLLSFHLKANCTSSVSQIPHSMSHSVDRPARPRSSLLPRPGMITSPSCTDSCNALSSSAAMWQRGQPQVISTTSAAGCVHCTHITLWPYFYESCDSCTRLPLKATGMQPRLLHISLPGRGPSSSIWTPNMQGHGFGNLYMKVETKQSSQTPIDCPP